MKKCKKCFAGAMRVHILSSGFCQECQAERDWKNGDREIRRQQQIRQRVAMFKRAEEYTKKKWKEKYGDDSIDAVKEWQSE
tara:strand:+ start:2841 stop:3083 length:243 start_codon:yes stop_codon:yes gene_type:complete